MEKEELCEFEMLEKVADISTASQLSLLCDPTIRSASCQPASDLTSACHTPSDLDIESHSTDSDSHSVNSQPMVNPNIIQTENDSNEDGEDVDLDETLKFTPSLAKGVEFNDKESWESFSHGSPVSRRRTESSGSDTTLSNSSPRTLWKSPVKKELLNENDRLFKSPLKTPQGVFTQYFNSNDFETVRDQADGEGKCTPSIGKSRLVESLSSSSGITSLSDSSSPSGHHFQDSLPPPPPSSLVTKLFPALQKVENKAFLEYQNKTQPPESENHKIPSPVSSAGEDSGIRSFSSTSLTVSEELKYKLNQLDEEIEKYKIENAAMEKLRKDREEVSLHFIVDPSFKRCTKCSIRCLHNEQFFLNIYS